MVPARSASDLTASAANVYIFLSYIWQTKQWTITLQMLIYLRSTKWCVMSYVNLVKIILCYTTVYYWW